MVGLRYGFYPRVPDVISRTSEVRASDMSDISHIYHIQSLFICQKIFGCIFIFLHFLNNYLVQIFVKFVKNDTFSNFLLI